MEIMPFLSDCIRSMIQAPEGQSIAVCDLGSIESRVLGWHSQCTRLNDVYKHNKDGYLDFGSEFYGIPYADITKAQRKYVKPPTLGCGYGLGGPGLIVYADGMGVTMTEKDANHAVKVFRRIYPEVPKMWYWIIDKCMECVKSYREFKGYGVRIYRDDHFLFITLPSGRNLAYYHPLVEMKKPPWKGDPPPRPTLTYMGKHKTKRVWVRNSAHGGLIVENICQAVARDILMYHIRILEADTRFKIIGHVHDEIITLVAKGFQEEAIQAMEQVMSISPLWLPNSLLGAKGFYTNRYTKH